ncbi:MAG TPA: hypothetical protein VMC04_04930 [Verrucomicrobiae bacterium]|nr:hypothetical protein [Verrucomicrobiae bacterium]
MSLDAGPVRRFCSLVAAVLLGALVAASPALSQSGRPRYDPAEIQRQVQKSVQLQRQALQSLSDPGRTEGLLRSAWTELRAAQHEMVMNASGAKFVDPLFEISNRKAQEALVHLQAAADALQSNRPLTGARPDQEEGGQLQASYLDGVRRHIEQAVLLTSGLAF